MNDTEPSSESALYVEYRTRFILDALNGFGHTGSESLVDFGCGDGRLLLSLVEELGVSRAVGVDYRAPVDQSTAEMEFVRCDFFEFDPSEPFDLVTSIQVFEAYLRAVAREVLHGHQAELQSRGHDHDQHAQSVASEQYHSRDDVPGATDDECQPGHPPRAASWASPGKQLSRVVRNPGPFLPRLSVAGSDRPARAPPDRIDQPLGAESRRLLSSLVGLAADVRFLLARSLRGHPASLMLW